MLTVITFLIVLSVLVLVHEFGHFIVAKRAGARVEEFGLGFPPRLLSYRKGETLYSLNLILFGGFVKIYGEDDAEKREPGSFGALRIGKRAQVLAAGVIMNALLALVILSVISVIGRPTVLTDANRAHATDIAIHIVGVLPGGPAAEAGIKSGDRITGVISPEGTVEITQEEQVPEIIGRFQGESITLSIERGSETLDISLVPRENPPPGEGYLGIALAEVGTVRTSWYQAPVEAVATAYGLIAVTVKVIALMVSGGGNVAQNLTGPVGIATLVGDAARLGIIYLLQLTAFLSLHLAILNILPFPALDGGRLAFLAVEKLKGSPVTPDIERITHGIGFALLMLLILWVTWNDIARLL